MKLFKKWVSLGLIALSSISFAHANECCISIEGQYDHVSRADFDRKSTPGEIGASFGKVMINMEQPVNEDAKFFGGIGWSHTHLEWSASPEFNQEDFNNLEVLVGASTSHVEDWTWKTFLGVSYDMKRTSFSSATLYKAALWGRYCTCNGIGLHIGAAGTAGIRDANLWPIIGIDYQPHDQWKVFLIFPYKISVEYFYDNCWSFELSGRWFYSRNRLAGHQRNPLRNHGIVEYNAYGLELGANYNFEDNVQFNLHMGSTLSGSLEVSNRKDRRKSTYDFNNSVYLGGEVAVHF